MPASGVRRFDRERFKELRAGAGLTLDQVAHRVGGAVVAQTVHKYEMGYALPSPARLVALAEAVGARPEDLLDFDRDNPTIVDLRVCRGLDAKALAVKAGLAYEAVMHPIDKGTGPRELSDTVAQALAGALEVSVQQVRAAYAATRATR